MYGSEIRCTGFLVWLIFRNVKSKKLKEILHSKDLFGLKQGSYEYECDTYS